MQHPNAKPSPSARKVAPSPPVSDLGRLLQELNRQAEHGQVNQALEIFDQVWALTNKVPKPFMWNTVLKAYANSGDAAGAEVWFHRMRSACMQVTSKAFGKLIESAAKFGQVWQAESWLLQACATPGITPSIVTYSVVLDACTKAADPSRQESWLRRIHNVRVDLDTRAYGSLIESCASSGSEQPAAERLASFIDSGFITDIECFTTLIASFSKKGKVKEATHWFNELCQCCLQPDSQVYTAVISAYANRGDPAAAVLWLERSQSTSLALDAVAFTSVVASFAKADDVVQAIEWFSRMTHQTVHPTAVSFTVIVDMYAIRGDVQSATRCFNKMLAACLTPDDVICTSMMRCCAKRGNMRLAEEWFARMQNWRLPPSLISYTCLIHGYARKGDATRASKRFDDAHEANLSLDVVSHTALLSAFAKARSVEKANTVMYDMHAAHLKPNVVTWTALISAYSACPPLDTEVEMHVKTMTDSNVMPNKQYINAVDTAIGRDRRRALFSQLNLCLPPQQVPYQIRSMQTHAFQMRYFQVLLRAIR